MNAIQLLLLSIGLYVAAAVVTLLKPSNHSLRLFANTLGVAASMIGIAAGAAGLISAAPQMMSISRIEMFGSLALALDRLSAFLVLLIGLVSLATGIYTYASRQAKGFSGFFTYVFLAAMLVVVTVTNGFYFLLFWEVMTLASYFLVVWKYEDQESIRAGYIYMLVAHSGAALILVAFLALFWSSGSFEFGIWRQAWFPAALKNLVFVLTFLGFGAKAGMVPLHFWAPGAYAAAPEHGSALMSAVMKKVAVYGILRISVDLLGSSSAWWGPVVLFFAAVTVIFGAFYALTEQNIKRLLAYSSIENVGIILMGAGIGMTGMATGQDFLTLLGFVACLYHMLNHAFFKTLLFLGAGTVIEQTGIQDLNRLGGLARRMPRIAFVFLVGALAISAIPPLNGFVSEWLLYQAFFGAARSLFFLERVFAPLLAALLALAGAFVLMVYVKAYAGLFAGPAQSQAASDAAEAPAAFQVSTVYLALGCVLLGFGAPWILPWMTWTAVALGGSGSSPFALQADLFGMQIAQVVGWMPWVALILLGLVFVTLLIRSIWGGRKALQPKEDAPWSCGYGYKAVMSIIPGSFNQQVRSAYPSIYRVRGLLTRPMRIVSAQASATLEEVRRFEPVVENTVSRPVIRFVETAGQWLQALHTGDIRIYCFYIILTLAILLLLSFGRSGL